MNAQPGAGKTTNHLSQAPARAGVPTSPMPALLGEHAHTLQARTTATQAQPPTTLIGAPR